MEQKRYESDMTPKEKRELERKKLKQMTAGQKLEYIWAYYKPHMAVALGIILLIVFIGQMLYLQAFAAMFSADPLFIFLSIPKIMPITNSIPRRIKITFFFFASRFFQFGFFSSSCSFCSFCSSLTLYPHAGQNFAVSLISFPQFLQYIIFCTLSISLNIYTSLHIPLIFQFHTYFCGGQCC